MTKTADPILLEFASNAIRDIQSEMVCALLIMLFVRLQIIKEDVPVAIMVIL